MVQEIATLQVKLDATKDEDEQRALEEDVTGKILWLCWCGICAEVDELLPKVVDCIGNMMELCSLMKSTPYTDPGGDQARLRQIMLDAGAGTSKHRLWLAARTAEQTEWSGTARPAKHHVWLAARTAELAKCPGGANKCLGTS
ncbi:hypothetical protein EDC04DRAFT_1450296 [Pisolithus marmoratus]|nr:hypothetical protein EDC04DRAFT_1450296 [Pisolithus marmoratus]